MSLDLEQNDWPYGSAATVINIDAEVVISRTGSNTFGWRGAYVCLGLLTFALAFPAIAIFVRDVKRPDQSAAQAPQLRGASAGEALRDRRF